MNIIQYIKTAAHRDREGSPAGNAALASVFGGAAGFGAGYSVDDLSRAARETDIIEAAARDSKNMTIEGALPFGPLGEGETAVSRMEKIQPGYTEAASRRTRPNRFLGPEGVDDIDDAIRAIGLTPPPPIINNGVLNAISEFDAKAALAEARLEALQKRRQLRDFELSKVDTPRTGRVVGGLLGAGLPLAYYVYNRMNQDPSTEQV